jgi:hypothetical protein
MNFKLRTSAAAILAVSLVALSANASAQDQPAPVKKHPATKKEKTPPGPTVEEQIQSLRQEMQGQIDGLKSDLASKDEQLKAAQQAAANAQAAADRANAAASAQNQAVTENAAAVTTLQSTVTDLKGNQASLATTVSDETASIKKAIESPSVLHYKGIGITPGGFTAGETVYRSKATGGDIPTAFSSLPYEGADAYSLSEFYGTARQSRVSLLAEGKTNWGTLKGYYEADWLGTGTSSNNNQSNSYVMRQRVIWGSAETNSHWKFAGGQMWSMATETKKGISNDASDILTPLTIDPNYVTGFVWTRQYGFRVVKSFSKGAFGVSLENPQLLYTASLAGNTPYAVLGSAGQNGGAYNATISACSPSTSVVNYTNQAETDSAGNTIDVAVPVYKTVNSCANVTNISFNKAPDFLVKGAFDPGWGHWELFGVLGFAHETVYPGETTNGNLYGGLTDVAATAAAGSTVLAAPGLTTAGYYGDSIKLGGMGASMRVPLIPNILTFGVKGLFGPGVGRYGDSTLSDVTANANGTLEPIHNVSGLVTVEANITPRFVGYLNYGGDYAGREDEATPTATTLGAPSAIFCVTGTTTCTSSPTGADIAAGGKWGATWKAPSAVAVGYGSRLLSNSSCNTITNPTYSGSSTGYYPGGSCGAQTRDVQEITGGWWYDIYKGDRGRFRQGFQYGYAVREGWSGAGTPAIGAKGIDNMFWTSLRYYLP